MSAAFAFNGLTIVPHALALDVRTTYTVERIPLRRRRRYYVKKTTTSKPGAYQSGGVLYMHPELVAKLKAAGGQR